MRDTLRDYLRKHRPRAGVFYAERVWEHIANRKELSALKMESDLAALADLVVVIVESPGTFAELGAFSLSDPLRKKLLPIVDKEFRHQESFLATGPLRWIDAESGFAPTIYVPLSQILQAVDEIEERIARIPRPHSTKISDLAANPKPLLFFICDLISVIHPATIEMIEYYLGRIAPSILASSINVSALIGLGLAMNLLQTHVITRGDRQLKLVSPAIPDAVDRPYHHRRLLDLKSQRAAHVSVLLAIPEARNVLLSLRKVS